VKQVRVLERVYDRGRLQAAWQQVKRNAGAAGIDEMTVKDFESRKGELLELIHQKLKALTYRFKPARRVSITKEGSSKKRKLGIPVVMDRIVSRSIALVFEGIFGLEFTESNFGFRRGKSQHQAIRHVQERVREGYVWCASVDLESFFDEIPHKLILKLIRRKVADERLVTLIARELKAGVIVDGKFEKTEKGCPQGSPLSPMISNIVLNEVDQELERRGLQYSRWADDCVIMLKSERAARRVLESIIKHIEEKLELPVNKDKSRASKVKDITFLGFQILSGKIKVSNKARNKFKQRIRELTRRNNPLSMYQIIQELNGYLRGWILYFRVQEFKCVFRDFDRWIRSRLRSMQLKKWKKARKFQHIMIKSGFGVKEARKTWVKMNKWQSINRKEVRFVMNKEWFRKKGLIFLHDFTLANLNLEVGR
jgi:group II intron reverse transcriptase/maturase